MFSLLNVFPRLCSAGRQEDPIECVLKSVPTAYQADYASAIRELERAVHPLGGSASNTGAANETVWCHKFLMLLHEKYMAAYSHIEAIKKSVREKIYAKIEGAYSQLRAGHENLFYQDIATYGQALGKAKHYNKTVAEVLYPEGTSVLREAEKSYDCVAHVEDHGTVVISMRLFADIIDDLQGLLERLLGAFNLAKGSREPIKDDRNSVLMMRCCSMHVKFAQRFADLLTSYHDIRYRHEISAAVRNRNMFKIDEWRSEMKKQALSVSKCFDISLMDLKYRAAVIHKLNAVLKSFSASSPNTGNPAV
ncbi:hypothetical protein PAPHI01_1282 [Pancytospora philotis]|nr:hypothetical protein PAPHI01_1282 [Pancytospora philotis]